jgi:hypothetical protein
MIRKNEKRARLKFGLAVYQQLIDSPPLHSLGFEQF